MWCPFAVAATIMRKKARLRGKENMKVLFFLAFFTAICVYLFYLLTRRTIREVYETLDDKNEFVRKTKAFFVGIFRLIAY